MQSVRVSNLVALSLVITLLIGTVSTVSADYSGDDDQDGIGNGNDKCFNQNNWKSNVSNDADSDGCQDDTEDWDDLMTFVKIVSFIIVIEFFVNAHEISL